MCTCHIFDMNFRWYVNIMNINNNCMNHTLPNCLPNIQLRTLRRTWCGNLSRHGHKTPVTKHLSHRPSGLSRPYDRTWSSGSDLAVLPKPKQFRRDERCNWKWHECRRISNLQPSEATIALDLSGQHPAALHIESMTSFPKRCWGMWTMMNHDKSNLRELDAMLQDASGTTALWRAVHGGHVQPV